MFGKKRFGSWVILTEIAVFALVMLLAIPGLAGDNGNEKPWYTGFMPILILLGVVAFVIWRLPKIKEERPGQLAHLEVDGYCARRAFNWLLLGASYAFLYWGRYNLNVAYTFIGGEEMVKNFNQVFYVGAAVYGVSFLINGPLTDRFGGRFSILIGCLGASIANLLMGVACWMNQTEQMSANSLFRSLIILYSINMYFQSYGAVAIVKANSTWFHVRERGVFGAVFGILIALGIYFAYDWTSDIIKKLGMPISWAFYAPAAALATAFILDLFWVRNRPSEAGFNDFNTEDASAYEKGPRLGPVAVFKIMLGSGVVMTIACVEFCSGFLRQAIMQQYRFFAKLTGESDSFVYDNWGLLLCCAGILGGVFAGTISDRVFHSRRPPVAAVLYIGMLFGSVGMCFLLGSSALGWLIIFMSLCVIGVHGMLSGTATQDFGGTKNVGICVGIIDGFVYAGTAAQSWLYTRTLPQGEVAGADNPANWWFWPIAMVPIALIGLILAYKARNAKPKSHVEREKEAQEAKAKQGG